ncbi:ankyrin repeat-containing protein ITN1-like [Cucurbita moschata]|uniref:Ankyrin repeat-containing protein ITN1-like n=1 Tax=Cucurbita moschata TaxID=3662 RepID=A0A6J1GQZ1_CUCMO|nr:ankyrin repeat-containing protein ITN1-like [Cucurbita moschata]
MDLSKQNKECYILAMRGEWDNLGKVCKEAWKLVLPITGSGDTSLHLAVHSGKEEPLKTFLAQVMEIEYTLYWKSFAENTPLHEAATVGNLGAVKLLVELRKEDLLEMNIRGETPLYRAARYGKLEIVEYILNECEDYYTRSPLNWMAKGTPIIHAAIQSENFEMVMMLVDFDKSLLEMKDSKNQTALHVLANMPHIFESGYLKGFWAKLIYDCNNVLPSLLFSTMIVRISFFNFLIFFLLSHHRQKTDGKNIEYMDYHETPLLLAAARGIIEVVERIIKAHPQAVDYVTTNDRNILHVIIAHRQLNIFEWIQRRDLILHRLAKRIDVLGYTVLHHVGITKFLNHSTFGPAIQLQNEIDWFDRVHEMIPHPYNMHYSKDGWKPREFFDETHQDMLDKGKEWIKKTSESCSAVAVLMATVAFAAAFTVPGGLNSKTGSPVLLSDPIYILFTALDIASLISSLSSLVLFLLILTSPFEMDAFRQELPIQLSLGFNLLFLSVASTMIAFAVAVVLTLKSTNMVWAECLLYLVTLAPITIFVVMKLSLLMELERSVRKSLRFLWKLLPMGFLTMFVEIPSKVLSNKST